MDSIMLLARNLPVIVKDRKILIFFLLASILLAGFVFASGYVVSSYNSMVETQLKIDNMGNYLAKHKKLSQKIEHAPYRPVMLKDAEGIQSDILLLVQANSLKMESVRTVKSDDVIVTNSEKLEEAKDAVGATVEGQKENKKKAEGSNHKTYELSIEGSYQNTMNFLYHVQDSKKKALINIRNLTIQPENADLLKTKLVYKIYVK